MVVRVFGPETIITQFGEPSRGGVGDGVLSHSLCQPNANPNRVVLVLPALRIELESETVDDAVLYRRVLSCIDAIRVRSREHERRC